MNTGRGSEGFRNSNYSSFPTGSNNEAIPPKVFDDNSTYDTAVHFGITRNTPKLRITIPYTWEKVSVTVIA